MSLSRRISQCFPPQLVRYGQHISSSIQTREAHNSALSRVHLSEINPSNIRTKVRNKRKMYKPESLEVAKISDVVETDKSTVHRTDNLKVCFLVLPVIY